VAEPELRGFFWAVIGVAMFVGGLISIIF